MHFFPRVRKNSPPWFCYYRSHACLISGVLETALEWENGVLPPSFCCLPCPASVPNFRLAAYIDHRPCKARAPERVEKEAKLADWVGFWSIFFRHGGFAFVPPLHRSIAQRRWPFFLWLTVAFFVNIARCFCSFETPVSFFHVFFLRLLCFFAGIFLSRPGQEKDKSVGTERRKAGQSKGKKRDERHR